MLKFQTPHTGAPRSCAPLSQELIGASRFVIGHYSARNGPFNPFGRGQRSLPITTGLNSSLFWTLGGGQYVEVGSLSGLFNRAAHESPSFTIIAVASLTAAGSFPMLFSAFNGTQAGIELRGNSGTGRPQIVVQTTGGEVNASLASSIVGAGLRSIVATFTGSTVTSGTTPSRAAVWSGREFAESSSGDGLLSTLGTPRLGVRAGGTSLPWAGQLHDMIVLNGAIPDAMAARIATAPEEAYRVCFAPRRIWVPVTPTAPTVTAPRIEPTATFGTATVSRVAVAAVSPARIESTAAVAAPVVTRASVQAVTANRIESAVSFGTAIVSANGIAAVAPARIESAVAFGIPTVSATGPAQIAVGRIESAAIVRAPLVVRTGPDVEEATSGKGRRKRRPMMAGTPYTHDDYMQWVVRTVAAVAATGVFDA